LNNHLFRISLATYTLSWFTKVHSAQKGAYLSWLYGWEAFRVALSPIWPGSQVITSWSDGSPYKKGYDVLGDLIPFSLSVPSALTNGWMIFLLTALALKKVKGMEHFFQKGFVFCFCLNIFWFFSPLNDYFINNSEWKLFLGYYLWAASFAIAGLSLPPPKENWKSYLNQVFRRLFFPAFCVSILFFCYFSFQAMNERLKDAENLLKRENQSKTTPNLRTLPYAELTSIPATSKTISTPFLHELNKRVEADPKDAAPLVERGYLYAIWGNEAEAMENFEKALVLTTNKPSVYRSMGWALLNLNRFQEARDTWSKAWEPSDGKPEPSWAPRAMAIACWKSGDKNEALAWYQRAVERNPESLLSLEGIQKETISWNIREQNWLIEVYHTWKRTYLDRDSVRIMKQRLQPTNSSPSCKTCR
jgi:tetratricopeptide (TPR) repeat protein